MQWLEGFLIDLASEMRLEAAVPVLVERMCHGDDWLSDSCVTALPNIGGDAVVSALADQWRRGNGEFRRGAAEVMGHIHTDLSVAKLLEFFPREKDADTKEFLAIGLLENFALAAVEPIRAMVLGDELTPDEMDIRCQLIAACTIMGATFPEYPRWYQEALKDNFGWHDYHRDRIRHNFRETEDDEWDDALDDDLDESGLQEEPLLIPFPDQRKSVGRNEPCPCGSGKKYKKCCLSKDQARDSWLN